jgi:hypothetical protein
MIGRKLRLDRQQRPYRRIALGVLAATIAMQLASLIVVLPRWDEHRLIGYGADLPSLFSAHLFGLAAALTAYIVVRAQPRNAVGWLLGALGLAEASMLLGIFGGSVLVTDPSQPEAIGAWLASTALQPTMGAFVTLLMLVFPDGRLVGRRWRWVGLVVVVGAALRFVELGFGRGSIIYLPTVGNPMELPHALRELLTTVGSPGIGLYLLAAAMGLGAISLLVRYRGTDHVARQQIRWFVASGFATVGAAITLVHIFVSVPPAIGVGQDRWVLFYLATTLQPIAIAIAVTRYRLYEIDRIINRTFVYGSLTAVLAGAFTASVVLSQRVFVAVTGETSDLPFVATTLVVVALYTPVRARLEAVAARHLKYDDPHFGAYRDRMEDVLSLLDPVEAASRLLDEVLAELATDAGRVEFVPGMEPAVVEVGAVGPTVDTLVIEVAERVPGPIARVVVAPSPDAEAFDPAALAAATECALMAQRVLGLRGPFGWPARHRGSGRRAGRAGATTVLPSRPLAMAE